MTGRSRYYIYMSELDSESHDEQRTSSRRRRSRAVMAYCTDEGIEIASVSGGMMKKVLC